MGGGGNGAVTADGYEVFLGGDENVLKRTVSDGGTTLNRLKVTGSYTSTGRIVPNVNYTSTERLLKATRTPAANCKPASCPTHPLPTVVWPHWPSVCSFNKLSSRLRPLRWLFPESDTVPPSPSLLAPFHAGVTAPEGFSDTLPESPARSLPSALCCFFFFHSQHLMLYETLCIC